MARSNGPLTPPTAGRANQRPDPQSWAQGTTPRPAANARPMNPGLGLPASQPAGFQPQSAGAAYQQAAYNSHQQPAQPAYNAQPSQSAADQRYAAPSRPQVQVSEPRTAPPQQRAAAAPQSAFDSFVSQQAPANGYQAAPYDNTNARQNSAYPSLGQGAQNGYGDAGANDQQGFGHWGNAPAADARGFDYGSYGAPAPANNGHAQAGYGQQQPHYGQNGGFAAQDEWGHNEGYDQEPSLDASGYGHDQHGYHGEQGALEQSYAEDEEYEDEPRPRRKLTLIAAAVAGALMCGGGLAYGYKTFLGPVATASNTPLIKTSSIPSKVKPDDPGGRKFAHSEPSIMGGGAGKVMGEPLTDGAAAGAENARKVQTVEVRPDGSVVPSSGGTMSDARPPSMSASASDFPTAGESIGGSSAGSPEPQVMAKAEPTPPPAAAPPPRQEAVVDEAPPAVTAPKKVQAKRVAAAAAPEGTIGAPAPSGAGWVAVLASVPVSGSSQMDSLKQFADMQQKYGEVLGDKTPSVQEANLGEKGRYHRLVVGPPGSRDSANSVCGSLKSAGFTGCWVAQY